ncbi:c-type cytochrome [Aquincola tertiaricarbonis]|uniref:c-type cytochrome n=1 Tax=Aquincola tertiaricarbonis TaxID=391953 RepID=UPI000614EE57|nr:transporter substrate-binding domain-containing protein [Aquincola tertiaricarbonis]
MFTCLDKWRRSLLGAGLAAACIGAAAATGAVPAEGPLRACADPDNLPFSSAAEGPKGFYVELADKLSEALGRGAAQEVWHSTLYARRAVRSTLLARRCDLYIGLPAEGDFMRPQVVMSAPFAVHHYALVLPPGQRISGVAELRGRRVAVQLLTPPHQLLATTEGMQTVTVRSPEEGLQALADGQADVAWLWGPSAGYHNRTRHAERWQVLATDGPGMAWPVAIGFRRDDAALRAQVQQQLDGLQGWITGLAAKYGFPAGPALPLAAADAPVLRLAAAGAVGGLMGQATAAVVADAAGSDAMLSRGRTLFNTNCSHCHGPNAQSPEARIDLRKLGRRYGDEMTEVFHATVRAGRPDKGMPAWKGVLAEDDIASIKAFVDSVQQRK